MSLPIPTREAVEATTIELWSENSPTLYKLVEDLLLESPWIGKLVFQGIKTVAEISPKILNNTATELEKRRILSSATSQGIAIYSMLKKEDEIDSGGQNTSNLMTHARNEMILAGMFDGDADYGAEFAANILATVNAFRKFGHSGFSAQIAIEVLYKLLKFENLSPINDDPSTWIDVSDAAGRKMWQSKRNARLFSEDDGKTYYDVDTRDTIITSEHKEPKNETNRR